MVEKNEPKLWPVMPMRSGSISGRPLSHSYMARPASSHAGTLTGMPSTALSYCPGPSMVSTAMPRDRNRSPYIATTRSL